MPNNDSTIKTISKAVKVLKAISTGNSRLSDITREVNLTKNGVFRLLHSLMKDGIVVQDPVTREYYMGPMLFEITVNPLKTHEHFINIAYLEMDDLKQVTGETISLDIKFGVEKILLRRLLGTHDVTYVGKPNPISHLWVGSTGKALLAQISEQELDSLLKHVTLESATPFSITDKEVFKQDIMRTRERGYAASFNETDMGVGSLAIPITGYIAPAALAIIGPEDRVTSRVDEYVKLLKIKAAKISRQLISGQW